MSKGKLVKRNVKDSVFTNLFQHPKYVAQLYEALHPEAGEISEDQIEIVTLKNILTDNIYNDLGFTVDGKLVVLVEAQSTWTANIIVRGLMYLVQTYQDYIEKEQLNVYGSVKLELPKPELYVIYTGGRKVEKEYITLSEEFFGGEQSALEVRVRVISDGEQGDIINQYVTFTVICAEQMRLHGRTQEAIAETIRICKDRNVLKEYLSSHEREVHNIMFALFDDEQILNATLRDYEKKGRKEGREEGIGIGIEKGIIENTKKLVFRLLGKNKSDEDIMDTLDISRDTLMQLKAEYAKA